VTSPLEFFSTPGMMTSPGSYAHLLEPLPVEVEALCQVVQGLMIHIFWADQYGVQLAASRRDEVQIRPFAQKLECILQLDPHPLTGVRKPDQRLVGNCRDFSLMLTAILRYQGVPARARCGFGRYFGPNHYEDHWVCEYWNPSQTRWVLVDAQLDALQRDKLQIEFNPLDVPRDQFIVGGKAWQLCRQGQADPETFGIFDMQGLWFVRGNLLRDVASLNKIELLPWDSWGMIEARDKDLSADDLALLDQVAELTASDVPEFDRLRLSYENDDRLRVPKTIRSYTPAGVQVIHL
jgi:Transglutaminase-like superfamily